jgi:hypothetical protein
LQRKLEQLRHEAPRAHSAPLAATTRNVRARLGRDQIERLVANYVTTTQLIEEYGISKTAVLALLRSGDVELRRQPLEADEIAAATQMYESGAALATIQQRLKLPRETVRRALIAAGVRMRSRGGRQAASS